MDKDAEILESLIAGGVIGASLAAILTRNKDAAGLGAIAGAVILASYRANQIARRSSVPLIMEEGDSLYEILPGGAKRFIKKIPRSSRTLPKNFTLR
jgi:hypothetical protein